MGLFDHLDNYQEQQKQNIMKSFEKGEQPREGEVRHWKDGDYKFEDGHWKKQAAYTRGEDILNTIKAAFKYNTDELYKKLYTRSKQETIDLYESKSREELKKFGITDKEKFINEIKEAVKIELPEGELQTIFNKLDHLAKHGKEGDSVAYYNEMKSKYKDFDNKAGELAQIKRGIKKENIVGNENLDQIKEVMGEEKKEKLDWSNHVVRAIKKINPNASSRLIHVDYLKNKYVEYDETNKTLYFLKKVANFDTEKPFEVIKVENVDKWQDAKLKIKAFLHETLYSEHSDTPPDFYKVNNSRGIKTD